MLTKLTTPDAPRLWSLFLWLPFRQSGRADSLSSGIYTQRCANSKFPRKIIGSGGCILTSPAFPDMSLQPRPRSAGHDHVRQTSSVNPEALQGFPGDGHMARQNIMLVPGMSRPAKNKGSIKHGGGISRTRKNHGTRSACEDREAALPRASGLSFGFQKTNKPAKMVPLAAKGAIPATPTTRPWTTTFVQCLTRTLLPDRAEQRGTA